MQCTVNPDINDYLPSVGMAGTSDHFLNSPGFVYGYIGKTESSCKIRIVAE
jgi:hypothetical protein